MARGVFVRGWRDGKVLNVTVLKIQQKPWLQQISLSFDTPHGLNHWEWIIIHPDFSAAGWQPSSYPHLAPVSTQVQLLLLKSGIK